MITSTLKNRNVWLGLMLLAGLLAGSLLSNSPIHAVATSQQDNLIMCTGNIDGQGEAVYILDVITGALKTYVLNTNGKFTIRYENNIITEWKLDTQRSPKYTLVTGQHVFRRRAGMPDVGNSVLYVAELTTGKMVAYGMPWNRNIRNQVGAAAVGKLVPLDMVQFRGQVVRNIDTP